MSKRDREAVRAGLHDILGVTESSDLIGSVIQSDRRRAGRAETPREQENLPPPSDSSPSSKDDIMTSHNVIKEYDNKAFAQHGKQAEIMTSKQPSNTTSPIAIVQATQEGTISRSEVERGSQPKREARRKPKPGPADILKGRLSEAKELSKSPTTTVTLRLPKGLNDWLDEYVHRSWPKRIRKQELVIEGLRILFARRGRPGEEVIDTELLAGDEG